MIMMFCGIYCQFC